MVSGIFWTLSIIICGGWHIDLTSAHNYIPKWVVSNAGLLNNMDVVKTRMRDYKIRPRKDRASDGEHIDALREFFWDKYNLVAMELGAMDGVRFSETLLFEQEFGWRRILIEGNPFYRKALAGANGALAVNAVICEAGQSVHYPKVSTAREAATAGIVEYMTPAFFKSFHYHVYQSCNFTENTSAIDWSNANCAGSVDTVPCVPLSVILDYGHVRHIDFFVLDVEGAELTILKTVPWDHISFSVIVVETDAGFRSPEYGASVVTYLTQRGYDHVDGIPGRNSWFTRKNFKRSRYPQSKEGCFTGATSAMMHRGRVKAWKDNSKEFDCLYHVDPKNASNLVSAFSAWEPP
jgi:hypothetical protein